MIRSTEAEWSLVPLSMRLKGLPHADLMRFLCHCRCHAHWISLNLVWFNLNPSAHEFRARHERAVQLVQIFSSNTQSFQAQSAQPSQTSALVARERLMPACLMPLLWIAACEMLLSRAARAESAKRCDRLVKNSSSRSFCR